MIEYIAFCAIKEMDWLHGVQFFCAKEHLWQQNDLALVANCWERGDAYGSVTYATFQHTNAPTVAPSIAPTDQTDKCSLSRPVAVHSGRLGRGLLYSCHWEPGLECNLHNLRNLRSKCAPILYLLSCLQPRPHTAQWPSNGIDNNFSSHWGWVSFYSFFKTYFGLLTRTRKKAASDNC